MVLAAALLVAAAVAWAGAAIARELARVRDDVRLGRRMRLLAMFAPGVAEADANPRAFLTWQPLALTARKLFPDDFESLDRASGTTFPFTNDQIQAAHSKWTAEWLAWERTHDAQFKLKAAAVERDLVERGNSPLELARLESVEREKLELYQRRYEEYIRVGKALQALLKGGTGSGG